METLTGNILGTAFRALFEPYMEEDGECSNSALKSLTFWFPSSNLNKCVCFCAGDYCGNDLAVRVAALHCGSSQELWELVFA